MGWSDLLATVDGAALDHLGGPVTYAPGDGQPAVVVNGIFDAVATPADLSETHVGGTGPAVWLRLADLPTDPEDDEPTITVDAVAYRVRSVERDGAGGAVLRLHRA